MRKEIFGQCALLVDRERTLSALLTSVDKIFSYLSQRKQNRRNYNYDADDIIEGKRTFSVEEKLSSPKFAEGDFVQSYNNGDGGSMHWNYFAE